jgi:sugar O-acyltransferase (sialic acid O-acetyltransferase NeuD family)
MNLAIYGYGGHAREVAAQILYDIVDHINITFFVDDKYANEFTKPISTFNPDTHLMMVAVADSNDRYDMVKRLPEKTKYFTFIHSTTMILDKNIEIGEGSFIGAQSILTTNIKIGKHAILNRGNHIGHDCMIGDYFSIMPNAVVGGNVTIKDKVYIGSCSNVKEKINICDSVIIGMNAAVVKNIVNPGTYVGVPAKQIK